VDRTDSKLLKKVGYKLSELDQLPNSNFDKSMKDCVVRDANQTLKKLNLSWNFIDDDCLKDIKNAVQLSANYITAQREIERERQQVIDSARAAAGLKSPPKKKEPEFRPSAVNNKIESINLSNNRFSAEAHYHLSEMAIVVQVEPQYDSSVNRIPPNELNLITDLMRKDESKMLSQSSSTSSIFPSCVSSIIQQTNSQPALKSSSSAKMCEI